MAQLYQHNLASQAQLGHNWLMEILAIKQAVIDRLEKETRASLAIVAQQTGLSLDGLAKLRDGRRLDPRVSTLAALASYYRLNGESGNE